MSAELIAEVHQVFAREPLITVAFATAHDGICVDLDVIAHGIPWELHVLATVIHGRAVPPDRRLQAWLGENLTPLGPLVDTKRSLFDRLTPICVFADTDLQPGNGVVFDELDHVRAVTATNWRPTLPRGIVIRRVDDNTADVIRL